MSSIKCKIALNKIKGGNFPYKWDLNIYRGCSNGCKYCYAQYSHKHLQGNFFKNIYTKENIIEVLDKELRSRNLKQEIINIGGVTDSYQQIESKMKLMPQVLKLLVKYRTPAIISTKSDLILRDYDLINKLSKLTYVNIASSITTLDEKLSSKLEPGSSTPAKRFNILKEFRKSNASIGLHIMPIVPLLTDGNNLENLYKHGKEVSVDYILPGTLYLKGITKPFFMDFIKKEFPNLFPQYINLYKEGKLDKNYKYNLYNNLNYLEKKYSISRDFDTHIKKRIKSPEDSYYNNLLF